MALILLHAWAVFATLLIIDVVLCAVWLLGIRADPAFLGSLEIGDLAPLVLAYGCVPVIAGVAFAAGIARRVVKPEVETGASSKVDLAMRPAAAAGAAAAAFALLFLAALGMDGGVVLGFGLVFGLVYVALALVTLVIRRVSLRRLTVAAGVVAAAAAVALVVAELRGRSRLTAQREEALPEVAAERQRQQAAVRPVLREPAVDGNAVDPYRPLMEAQRSYLIQGMGSIDDLDKAQKSPSEPPPPTVAAALERARGDLEKLKEATRARRAVWPTEYEKGLRAEHPYYFGASILAKLAIVDGNVKAHGGDVAGAAERYLEVLRFGTDFGDGLLSSADTGTRIELMATQALARLVRSPRGAPVLDTVGNALVRLEPSFIDFVSALRSQRLLFAMTGPGIDQAVGLERKFAYLIPWNAYGAAAVDGMSSTLRDMEALAAKNDPSLWQKFEDGYVTDYSSNPNFIYRALLPGIAESPLYMVQARAMSGMVRAAIALERRRAAETRYPKDPGPMPKDPMAKAGQGLQYRAADDGTSYVLYSVGLNYQDDGGKPNVDLLLPDAGWPLLGQAKAKQ